MYKDFFEINLENLASHPEEVILTLNIVWTGYNKR